MNGIQKSTSGAGAGAPTESTPTVYVRPVDCAIARTGPAMRLAPVTISLRRDISLDIARMVSSAPMPTFPGFTLPDELRLIRDQVRRFIREEIIPLEQRLDPDAPGIPDEDFKRLSEKTKAAGLWALGAPEAYGGGGMDTFAMSVSLEEMSQ